MHTLRRPRTLLALVVVLRWAAAAGFAVNTPLWERSDEINHYRYAHFVARNGRLPTRADAPIVPEGYEIYLQLDQPPLYYLLLVPAVLLADDNSILETYANPFVVCDRPFEHYYLHTVAERFPPQGTALAVWLGRILTTLIGLSVTGLVWLAARWLYPHQEILALQAAALYAWMPASIEFTTWLNNDSLLLLGGAIFLLGLARYIGHGDHRAVGLLLTGILVSTLTKLTGLALLPVGALLVLRRLRMRRAHVMTLLVALALLAAGFVGLNLARCGYALCRLHRYDLPFDSPASLPDTVLKAQIYVDALTHLTSTLTIPTINRQYSPPPALVLVGVGLILLGLAGCIAQYHRQRDARLPWLGTLVASATLLALARVWWLQVGYFHARYLAASLPALAILLAVGYGRWSSRFGWWAASLFLAASLLIPFAYYRPVYPDVERMAELPTDAVRVDDYVFENRIELGAYQVLWLRDGQMRLRLYWRAREPLNEVYFAVVNLYSQDLSYLDRCGITLGSAFWTTQDWAPGEWVAQDYDFSATEGAGGFMVQIYRLMNSIYIANTYNPDSPLRRTQGGYVSLTPGGSP